MRPTTTYPAGWLPVYLSACQPPLPPPSPGGQTDSDKDKSNSFLSAVNNSESSGKNIVLNAFVCGQQGYQTSQDKQQKQQQSEAKQRPGESHFTLL